MRQLVLFIFVRGYCLISDFDDDIGNAHCGESDTEGGVVAAITFTSNASMISTPHRKKGSSRKIMSPRLSQPLALYAIGVNNSNSFNFYKVFWI